MHASHNARHEHNTTRKNIVIRSEEKKRKMMERELRFTTSI